MGSGGLNLVGRLTGCSWMLSSVLSVCFRLFLLPCERPAVINPAMNQNDIAELREAFDIARALRRFVAEQLATGRSLVLENEVHEFLDNKFPDCPIEARRLLVRSEFNRLERASVIQTVSRA